MNLTTILSALRRRWWMPLLCLVLGAVVALGAARRMPKVYRASTLVLVEPQKIPVAYVRPTVTTSIEDRLRSLRQQITSRSRVERVIRELNLYPELRERVPMQSLVGRVASRINLDVRGGNTFRIIFTGTDPQTVADVTNKVADIVIEENSAARQREAQSTSAFLEKELEAVRVQLEKEEEAIAQFKREHMGELPEQRDANLRTLEGLQNRLRIVSDSLGRAMDRRILLDSQLADLPASGTSINETANQLEQARRRLRELEARYTQRHPDVVEQRQEVDRLRRQLSLEPQEEKEEAGGEPAEPPAAQTLYAARLNADIQAVESEIKSLTEEEAQIRADITKYQLRVENTPRNESILSTLTRDYQNLTNSYQSLLNKKLEAEMAEKLEHERRGEHFIIVDRAVPPNIPFKPNVPQIIAFGCAIAFMIGCGGAIVIDLFRPRFRSEEELVAAYSIPVLAVVPLLVSEEAVRRARRAKRLMLGSGVAVAALCALLVIFLVAGH